VIEAEGLRREPQSERHSRPRQGIGHGAKAAGIPLLRDAEVARLHDIRPCFARIPAGVDHEGLGPQLDKGLHQRHYRLFGSLGEVSALSVMREANVDRHQRLGGLAVQLRHVVPIEDLPEHVVSVQSFALPKHQQHARRTYLFAGA